MLRFPCRLFCQRNVRELLESALTEGEEFDGDIFYTSSNAQGNSHTVELRSGGKLTLILSVNMFDLVGEDRDFVFQVIDECQQYESRRGKPVKS